MPLRAQRAQMNIANGIREFARARPKAIAVSDDRGRTLTYRLLNERASRIANALLDLNLNAGDRVAVILRNRLEYPEVAAGLAKAGITMVPVNPRMTATEIRYILRHSCSNAAIIEESLAPTAAGALEESGIQTVLSIDGSSIGLPYEPVLENARSRDPLVWVDETEPFTIPYTAGTTGNPKGVLVSHRSRCLTFYCTALEWNLGPGKHTIAVAPMYHGAGFAFAYASLHTGGSLHLMPKFDPEELLEIIQDQRPSSIFLVPTHVQMIKDLGEKVLSKYDLSKLDTVYTNAAPMPQELKVWILNRWPHIRLHELYGSTEAGIVSNLRPPDQLRKKGCVGPPWFMTEVLLLDDEGQEVETGEVGELFSRSPFLFNGYFDDEAATSAATTAKGFFSAGDLAVQDEENYLYIVDRKKDMIISGGVNVYPREIEEVLPTHPNIHDAAVIGIPDSRWGEKVAAVVVTDEQGISPEEVEDFCRRSLAGYKVPREVFLVDSIPRNTAGKVLKRELREIFSSKHDARGG